MIAAEIVTDLATETEVSGWEKVLPFFEEELQALILDTTSTTRKGGNTSSTTPSQPPNDGSKSLAYDF